jgi:hypothetical protein
MPGRLVSTIRTCLVGLAVAAALPGCGTTNWSDTQRTATEQLLISDAVDRAVSGIDLTVLAGQTVFLETQYVKNAIDERYLVSTLRQHMLASGCIVKDAAEDAMYVVELRTGAVGTNRHQVLLGIPQTNLAPGQSVLPMAPTAIPEISVLKRTGQEGVCKIAVFAYNRETGQPVWQSGIRKVVSNTKDVWVFGTGPFQSGTIHEGTRFAGENLKSPATASKKAGGSDRKPDIAREIRFSRTPFVAKNSVEKSQPAATAEPSPLPPPAAPIAKLPEGPILLPSIEQGHSEVQRAGYLEPVAPPTLIAP